MARKSAASMSIVTILPGQRWEPPAELTAEQAKVWRAVAATKPTDWFAPDTHPILMAHCRHVCNADAIAAQIAKYPGEVGDKGYADLLKMQGAQTMLLVKTATSMRLTHQSKAKQEDASRNSTTVSSAGKPWERTAAVGQV